MNRINLPGKEKTKKRILIILVIVSIGVLIYEGSINLQKKKSEIKDNGQKQEEIIKPINEDKEDSDEVKEKINNISQKESDLYNEAYTLFFSNKYEDAINKANELLKNFPDSYMGYNIRGIAKAYSGDYDGGMEDIDNSLKINETYGYGRFNKALTYELYDNMDEALKWYNKALEVEEYVWSYYGIASIYGRKADVANTMKYLNKAISMDSEVRVVAKDEHDFDPVRNSKEFQEAVYN